MGIPERVIHGGTPEARAVVAAVARAQQRCDALNALGSGDLDAIRAAWAELTGQPVDPTFRLVPPVWADHGINLRVGRDVFINRGCTLLDIGGIDIGDEVLIGPNVSLITAGHPLDPATRRRTITASPIVVGRNVWLGAGCTVLGGVTIGDDAVVAAGAVVTHDVPAATLVAGVPARVLRSVLPG